MTHDFNQKLEFSLGEREVFDINLLKHIIPGCNKIEKTPAIVDKTGIDYIATLRKGAIINIDAKTREPGASKYWQYEEPEIALEIWSRCEAPGIKKKIGWTLDEASQVDYILYTFDRSDTDKYYFIPFQLLRNVFRKNYKDWTSRYFKKQQKNKRYLSEAVFIPASVVIEAINTEMTGTTYH